MDEIARRCTATAKGTGQQCGRAPILGGTVCGLHGGKAPAAIAAAKLRLLEGVEPAIARLIKFITMPPGLCEACGRCDDTSAIVGAIRTVLDRSGLAPTAKIEVSASPMLDEMRQLTMREIAERAERVAREARALADLEEPYDVLPEAIDASVIDADEVAI